MAFFHILRGTAGKPLGGWGITPHPIAELAVLCRTIDRWEGLQLLRRNPTPTLGLDVQAFGPSILLDVECKPYTYARWTGVLCLQGRLVSLNCAANVRTNAVCWASCKGCHGDKQATLGPSRSNPRSDVVPGWIATATAPWRLRRRRLHVSSVRRRCRVHSGWCTTPGCPSVVICDCGLHPRLQNIVRYHEKREMVLVLESWLNESSSPSGRSLVVDEKGWGQATGRLVLYVPFLLLHLSLGEWPEGHPSRKKIPFHW